jgi:hypothetical protein
VQKTQEIFCNALKSNDRAGFQRINDYSIFCFCKGPEFHVNIFSLFFFASFVYPACPVAPADDTGVAPEDGTGAPLRQAFSFPACPG